MMNAGGAGTSVGGNRTHSGWRQPQPAAQGGQRPLAPSMRIVEPAEPANILNKRWWMRPCLPIPASKRVSRRDTLKAERNGRGAAASTLSSAVLRGPIAVGPNQMRKGRSSQVGAASVAGAKLPAGVSTKLFAPGRLRRLAQRRRRFRVSGPFAQSPPPPPAQVRFRRKRFIPRKCATA